jgi:hypothetical protein
MCSSPAVLFFCCAVLRYAVLCDVWYGAVLCCAVLAVLCYAVLSCPACQIHLSSLPPPPILITHCYDEQPLQKVVSLNASAWEPHVTLGKIRAPKSTVAEVGTQVLTVITNKNKDVLRDWQESSPGVYLAGMKPRQAWIDWAATLEFPS